VARPGFGGGVEVEAGSASKVPIVVLAGEVKVAGARVGGNEHQAMLGGQALGAALRHEVLFGRGKTSKVVEDGYRALGGPWRREDGEAHRRIAGLGAVIVEAHGAAEAGVLAQGSKVFRQVLPP